MSKNHDFDCRVKYGGELINFEKLKKSELCLISRGYVADMRLCAVNINGNIITAKLLKAVELKYPNNFKPNCLLFKIATKMALNYDENGAFSAAIILTKFNEKNQ